jgi:GMP synthase PP-ATPase subunit
MTPEANISALCHEFTNALTEVLAENAVGLARRGRVARTHAAVKRHPEYNEHALCVAVETAFMRWEERAQPMSAFGERNKGEQDECCDARHAKTVSLSSTRVYRQRASSM